MSNYLTDIDPVGEERENECAYCGIPCDTMYCSSQCKREDNE